MACNEIGLVSNKLEDVSNLRQFKGLLRLALCVRKNRNPTET